MKKTTRRWILAGAVGVLVGVLPLVAHHGSAGYDHQNTVTLTGTVHSVEWTNPHSFIYLDVTTGNGTVETWALEGLSPNALTHVPGWTKDSFKPGARITIIGSLPREGGINGVGTFRNLDDHLHKKHILQTGEIRLNTGEVQRFGMGPLFSAHR